MYWVNTASGLSTDTDPNSVARVSAYLAGGAGSGPDNRQKIAEYTAKLAELQGLIDRQAPAGSGSGSAPSPGSGSGSADPNSPLNQLLRLRDGLINSILQLGGSVPSPGSNIVGTTASFGTNFTGTPIPFRAGSRTRLPEDPDPGDVLQAPLPVQAARGPITTLLDLVDRDQQENDLFPISTDVTWFARDVDRRLLPFTSIVQEVALRGPAAFAQRFTFDLGSIVVGDLLLGTALQIRLDHWLDEQTRNIYAAKLMSYSTPSSAWEYANGLGSLIVQSAELELDGVTVETLDGDFIHVYTALFNNYGAQAGLAYDHVGLMSIRRLVDPARRPTTFPVENGMLTCPLPFFFMRAALKEALPMTAIREGHVKINITLRPFQECVRIMSGKRSACDTTPLNTSFQFTFPTCTWTYDSYQNSGSWNVPPPFSFSYTAPDGVSYNWSFDGTRGEWANQLTLPSNLHIASRYTWNPTGSSWQPTPPPFNIAFFDPVLARKIYYWDGAAGWRINPTTGVRDIPSYTAQYGNPTRNSVIGDWSVAPPALKSVTLLTYGAVVEGELRSRMLRNPFELLHRELQTFYFQEPMKYSVGAKENIVKIQLPLEANHPIEEIIWFVRRKAVQNNNEWTNYSSVVESEWTPGFPVDPLLDSAAIQVNGTVLCEADEQFFRQNIASAHKGGFTAYSRFIYGYSFSKHPGEHQPSGSINASRVNTLRLTLNVKPPLGVEDSSWEVKVFCLALNWMRFENGLANAVFED